MVSDPTRAIVATADPARAERYAGWAPDGWVVRTVGDGEAALDALDADTDVLVVAEQLADGSGQSLVRRVRTRGHDCQVVLVTEGAPDASVADLGIDDLLVAPLGQNALRDCLERLSDRAAYDEWLQEYFALASRRAVLEAELSPADLDQSEEYLELAGRSRELRERVDGLLVQVSEGDGYEDVFRGLFPGTAPGSRE